MGEQAETNEITIQEHLYPTTAKLEEKEQNKLLEELNAEAIYLGMMDLLESAKIFAANSPDWRQNSSITIKIKGDDESHRLPDIDELTEDEKEDIFLNEASSVSVGWRAARLILYGSPNAEKLYGLGEGEGPIAYAMRRFIPTE